MVRRAREGLQQVVTGLPEALAFWKWLTAGEAGFGHVPTNAVGRYLILLGVALCATSCALPAPMIPGGAPIRNLGIYAAGEDAIVEVLDVIQPGEPGAWFPEGRWTEVVFRFTNISGKALTVGRDIHLVDQRGFAVSPLDETYVAEDLRIKAEQSAAATSAAGSAISIAPYVGILGSLISAAGETTARQGAQQQLVVREEMRRRAIPPTIGVAGGSTVQGSMFFNYTPSPQNLVVTYRAGGEARTIDVSLTPGSRGLSSRVEFAIVTTEQGDFRLTAGQPSEALAFATHLVGVQLTFSAALNDEQLQNLRVIFSPATFPCGKPASVRPDADRRGVRLSGFPDACLKGFAGDVRLIVAGPNVEPSTYLLSTRASGPAVAAARPEPSRPVESPAGPLGAAVTARTGERWAVVIGIDEYRDPGITKLRYASADAKAIHEFLVTRAGFKRENTLLLLNRDATEANIRKALGEFLKQKALKEDEVLIYYAGHGTTEPDSSSEGGLAKYLVPYDADSESLYSTAIPMSRFEEIFGRIQARKILLIQDTCFSGGSGTEARTFLRKGISRSVALTDRFLRDLSQREGRMVLTAADANQVSQESHELRHGIFTYYLLRGLAGDADLDKDGAITVRELHLYLQRKVHEKSGGNQTPQLYNIGDMVLVTLGPR